MAVVILDEITCCAYKTSLKVISFTDIGQDVA